MSKQRLEKLMSELEALYWMKNAELDPAYLKAIYRVREAICGLLGEQRK
jgi:hypothetical protein